MDMVMVTAKAMDMATVMVMNMKIKNLRNNI